MDNTTKFNDCLVHGYLKFPKYVIQAIDTPQFQRLRYLHQLGLVYLVFPNATHTRYTHSLGVCYLAMKEIKKLKKKQPELGISDSEIRCVILAGLLHDIGHGPFSHTFEKWAHRRDLSFHHEEMSQRIVDSIFEQNIIKDGDVVITKQDIELIKKLICGTVPPDYQNKFIFEIVANKRNSIDVDKFDYLKRDAFYAGISSKYDCDRLIDGARVIDNEICYPDKDGLTVKELYETRFRLFKNVYTHPTSTAIELMIFDVLSLASRKIKIEEKLKHVDTYLELTDNIIHEIRIKKDNKSKTLHEAQEILKRIDRRDLYCMVDEFFNIAKDITVNDIIAYQHEDKILVEQDIVIEIHINNYAMKDENPLKYVHFYKKNNTNMKINSDAIRISMLPNEFSEKILRIYVKDKKKVQAVRYAIENYQTHNKI